MGNGAQTASTPGPMLLQVGFLQGKEAAVGSPVCVLTQEAESGPETGTVGLGRVG